MADPELPMPGEPEEEEPAGGGGRGPCCWATAGIANAPAAQARERMILAARRWMRDKVVSFADMFILCALPFSVWTLRIRLVKRAGGCMASEGGGIPFGWKGPVVNFRSSVGPWRSWERASMASRRSWVRIPSAPPKHKQTNTLSIHFCTNRNICTDWTLPNLLHALSVSLRD
jgi:hypothetical protein